MRVGLGRTILGLVSVVKQLNNWNIYLILS